MMRFQMIGATIAAGLALVAVSCGSVSDEAKQDAGNVAAAFGNGFSTTGASSTLSSEERAKVEEKAIGYVKEAREAFNDAIFRLRLSMATEANGVTVPTTLCNLAASSGCAFSCPTTSSWKIACTPTTSSTSTCKGTTYTISEEVFSVTFDFANITGSGSSATGTLTLGMSMSGNVTGGKLDGKKLEGTFNMTVDMSALKRGSSIKYTPTCDNFSFKYDGKSISCEDLKSKMETSGNCSAT